MLQNPEKYIFEIWCYPQFSGFQLFQQSGFKFFSLPKFKKGKSNYFDNAAIKKLK